MEYSSTLNGYSCRVGGSRSSRSVRALDGHRYRGALQIGQQPILAVGEIVLTAPTTEVVGFWGSGCQDTRGVRGLTAVVAHRDTSGQFSPAARPRPVRVQVPCRVEIPSQDETAALAPELPVRQLDAGLGFRPACAAMLCAIPGLDRDHRLACLGGLPGQNRPELAPAGVGDGAVQPGLGGVLCRSGTYFSPGASPPQCGRRHRPGPEPPCAANRSAGWRCALRSGLCAGGRRPGPSTPSACGPGRAANGSTPWRPPARTEGWEYRWPGVRWWRRWSSRRRGRWRDRWGPPGRRVPGGGTRKLAHHRPARSRNTVTLVGSDGSGLDHTTRSASRPPAAATARRSRWPTPIPLPETLKPLRVQRAVA